VSIGDQGSATQSATSKLIRHSLVDRLFHWGMALAIFILLGTAFLPILGWNFAWVDAHWITGVILTLLIAFHIVRSTFWQDLSSMWICMKDFRNAVQFARWNLRISQKKPGLSGKYSLAQKLIHLLFTLVVSVTIITGCLMLAKIDTPWWERNPYWFGEDTWGVIYVLHDLSALLLVTMIMVHVYFALRPEKLHFTRSMILGWITRNEYQKYHDPNRWRIDT
tara:strand:+ start:182 stop:847 length:666 start_codon:yes stop_codon:yes gene_type:complete